MAKSFLSPSFEPETWAIHTALLNVVRWLISLNPAPVVAAASLTVLRSSGVMLQVQGGSHPWSFSGAHRTSGQWPVH